MKKKLLLTTLSALMLISLSACGASGGNSGSSDGGGSSAEGHTYVKHEAVAAGCESMGNDEYYTCGDCDKIFDADKNEIASIPTVGVQGHTYVLQSAVGGTCGEKGEIAHYTCENCTKLFDLTKKEIATVEGDYDLSNHASATLISIQTQPNKTAYKASEAFDPTGMAVVYKCGDCEGELIDNQFLTYTYQTAGTNGFTLGDTKVTVTYGDCQAEVSVTVSKEQAQISGVEAEYTTACGVAPNIEPVANDPNSDIVIKYYDASDMEVQASAMTAGNVYTAKISIAETDTMLGTETTATINVNHNHSWVDDANDWKKLNCVCKCGDTKEFYAMNYQSPYVDADNLEVDLSAFIKGTEDFQIKSVKKVIRMVDGQLVAAKDGEVVDIESTNEGMVYSFAANEYEHWDEYKPYYLTLSVVYSIGEIECPIFVEVKYVDKLIKTAEDLAELAYTGAASSAEGGTANTGYYVLAKDIDASEWTLPDSKYAWEEALGFCGMLEGNGYTISGLNVGAWKYGLFGALGAGSKIQNVNFTDVVMGDGACLFALVIRKTTFTNVGITFSVDSVGYSLADTADNCEFSNVSVTTDSASKLFVNTENPETITLNYFKQYTVTFDTDGGNTIEPVTVTAGRKVAAPETPVKTSDEYDYKFLGWYLGDTAWDFNTAITEDIELVAKWEQTVAEAVTYIETAEDLKKLMYTGAATTSGGGTAITEKYVLSKDIDASGVDIGSSNPAFEAALGFCGTLDGNGYTISNLSIVNSYGLFGTVGNGAIIENVTFENVSVAAASDYGLFAYAMRNATVKNVTIKFNSATPSFLVSNEALNCTFENVKITTSKDATTFNNATGSNVDAITYNYYGEIEKGTLTGMSFGNIADSGATNEYGTVYNFTQGWASEKDMGAFNVGALSGCLVSGTNALHFWIYNPNTTAVDFSFSGDMNSWNPTGDYVTTLAAQAWTEVIITPEIISQGDSGMWFVNVTSGAGTAGWQISPIYAIATA